MKSLLYLCLFLFFFVLLSGGAHLFAKDLPTRSKEKFAIEMKKYEYTKAKVFSDASDEESENEKNESACKTSQEKAVNVGGEERPNLSSEKAEKQSRQMTTRVDTQIEAKNISSEEILKDLAAEHNKNPKNTKLMKGIVNWN